MREIIICTSPGCERNGQKAREARNGFIGGYLDPRIAATDYGDLMHGML